MKTASTSVDGAGHRPLTVFCACAREAAAFAQRMTAVRRTHYGLFEGYLGALSGFETAVAVTGSGENAAYTAVRQLSHFFRPKLVAGFGIGSAVAEWLCAGDVVLVSRGSRYYCPVALADSMFHSDEVIFPSEEARTRVLEARTVDADPACLEAALASLNSNMPRGLCQSQMRSARVASSDTPLFAWRAREYVRIRYGVDAVDTESYGLLCAASDVSVPALCLKVIGDACAEGSDKEFGRRAKRAVRTAAQCLESGVTAALNCCSG